MGKKGKNKNQSVISVNEASPKVADKVEEKKIEPATAPAPSPQAPASVPVKVEEKPTIIPEVSANDENYEPFEEGTLKSKRKRNRKKKSKSEIN